MNCFTTRILAGALLLGNALLYGCGNRPHTTQFNLDFEYTDYRDQPAQWSLPDSSYYGYAAASDRNCRKHGGSSLRLEQIDTTKYAWARFTQELPDSLAAGREVELSGWIRTENVTDLPICFSSSPGRETTAVSRPTPRSAGCAVRRSGAASRSADSFPTRRPPSGSAAC